MSGSRIGGLKCRDKNISREADFYKRIGKTGGINSHNGGFAKVIKCNCNLFDHEHTKSQCAGKKGGTISKRSKL